MKLPIAILAGGLATRLRPLTETLPKSLIDVAGKPFIERQLELLATRGYERVVLCLGQHGEMIESALGRGDRWRMRLEYSFDGPKPLGTGEALRQALPLLGEAFLVMYGDSYLPCDFAAVERAFLTSGRLGLMTVYGNDDQFDRSNVLFRDDRIVRYDKSQRHRDMRHIDYGLGGLRREALEAYPTGEPLDLAALYGDLLAAGQLAGFEVAERYEIGSPAGLQETRKYFLSRTR